VGQRFPIPERPFFFIFYSEPSDEHSLPTFMAALKTTRPLNSPIDILGPAIAGGIGEAILLGFLLPELLIFIEKPANNRLFCLIVCWVNVIAL